MIYYIQILFAETRISKTSNSIQTCDALRQQSYVATLKAS
ncbi:hypothetical protein CAMSH0001_1993 [Campylobacter showae RM3277]|uniref:Uncharacterized protein n=1 Tax=Campylobacter showae RM3277 TaxID=553219 RepID=C6REA1_9BACT|nr:hypothetical protein CAMSH0001_1993 [Campylobacter showae RM3277]